MMYVVTVYVEGGERDGETFACGPFESSEEATLVAEALAAHGTPDVLDLYDSDREIAALL